MKSKKSKSTLYCFLAFFILLLCVIIVGSVCLGLLYKTSTENSDDIHTLFREQENQALALEYLDKQVRSNFTALILDIEKAFSDLTTEVEHNITSLESFTKESFNLLTKEVQQNFTLLEEEFNEGLSILEAELIASINSLNGTIQENAVDAYNGYLSNLLLIRNNTQLILSNPSTKCNLNCQNGGIPNTNCDYCDNCAVGWGGTQCDVHIGSCNITCSHEGIPDETCSYCTSCSVGWTGTYCEQWNQTTTYEEFLEYFEDLTSQAEKTISKRSSCANSQIPIGIGNGVNWKGEIIDEHPQGILVKDYDNPQYFIDTFGNEVCMPGNIIGTRSKFIGNLPNIELNTISEPDDIQILFNERASGDYIKPINSYIDEYCDLVSDLVNNNLKMFILDATYDVIRLKYPDVNNLPLRLDFSIALNSLPPYEPEISNIRAIYDAFFEVYGIGVIVETNMGSTFTIKQMVNACIFGQYTNDELEVAAQTYITDALGMGSPVGTSAGYSYAQNIVQTTVKAFGGDSTEFVTLDENSYQTWRQSTIGTTLVNTEYVTVPLDSLIYDQEKKESMQRALSDYTNDVRDTIKSEITCGESILDLFYNSDISIQPMLVTAEIKGVQHQNDEGDYTDMAEPNEYSSISLSPGESKEMPSTILNSSTSSIDFTCLYTLTCRRDSTGRKVRAEISSGQSSCTLDNYWCQQTVPGINIPTYYGEWVGMNDCSIVNLPAPVTTTLSYVCYDYITTYVKFACCTCNSEEDLYGTARCSC